MSSRNLILILATSGFASTFSGRAVEPMVGVTNAVNMAQKGTYHELQSIAPGATWRSRTT